MWPRQRPLCEKIGTHTTSEHKDPPTIQRVYSQQPPCTNLPTISRKRLKVALACDPCRERKVRCDGGKPLCISCKRKQYTPAQCVYSSENAKTAKSNEYIGALLDRIHHLESKSRERSFAGGPTGDADVSVQPSTREHEGDTDDTRETPSNFRVKDFAGIRRPETEQPGTLNRSDHEDGNTRGYSEDSSPINAMGTTSTISEGPAAQGEDFYGASSVVSFLNEIRETFLGHFTRREAATSRVVASNPYEQTSNFALGLWNDVSTLDFEQLSLPPRTLADHLLSCYWSRVHCLYPFVHKQSFQKLYEALWAPENESPGLLSQQNVGLGGSKCRKSVFYCALNAVFALGCQFSDLPPAERNMLSKSFFHRSKKLLQFDILDNGDLALVQTFLIVTQYLQSTQSPSRCWNVIGMAYRVAEGLGLHLDNCDNHFSVLELEMRRRAWHGCVMLDMVVSMALGRPALTSNESHVPLPSVVDDQYLDSIGQSCEQPIGVFSYTNFFVETIKLYQNLGTILTNIYRPWSPSATQSKRSNEQFNSKTMAMIIEMDTALTDWESQLPDKLHWVRRELINVDEVLERQSNVLHARFLHLKVLLYRPMFNQFCRKTLASLGLACRGSTSFESGWQDETGNGLYFSFLLHCSEACIEAAQELISTIDMSSRGTTTGAWWYNVFYLFTSAMVLILADLCPMIPGNSPYRDIHSSWRECLETLDRLESAVGVKYSQTLGKMRQQVFSVQKLQHGQPSTSSITYPHRGASTDSVQPPTPPTPSSAQYQVQDFDNIDFLFDDEQLRGILWQDAEFLATL